jgi:hypothetical protein
LLARTKQQNVDGLSVKSLSAETSSSFVLCRCAYFGSMVVLLMQTERVKASVEAVVENFAVARNVNAHRCVQ